MRTAVLIRRRRGGGSGGGGGGSGGGGGASLPNSLFGGGDTGDWWDRENSRMFQEAAESTAVTTDEDRIGSIRGGFANTQLQEATTFRPYYEVAAGPDPRLDFRNAQRLYGAAGAYDLSAPTLIWRGIIPGTTATHMAWVVRDAGGDPFYIRWQGGPVRVQYRTDAQLTQTSANLNAYFTSGVVGTIIYRGSDGKWFGDSSVATGELPTGLATPSYSVSGSEQLYIGGNAGGTSFLNLDTYFWMAISRALTDQEVTDLMAYLDETYP